MSDIRKSPIDNDTNEEGPRLTRRDLGVGGATLAAAAMIGGTTAEAKTVMQISDDELIYMSAAELLPLFKARRLSPVEVLKAQIARYDAVNQKVNCITYIPGLLQDPKILVRDDAEVVGDGVAELRPPLGDSLGEELRYRRGEFIESGVALVVRYLPVHDAP